MQREKQKGAGLTRLPAFELVFRRLPWTSSGSSHWDNPLLVVRLFGGHRHHIDRHIFSAEFAGVKAYRAFFQSKQRVVFTNADVRAGVNFRAALADNDVAADHVLTTELFHAEAAAR